MSSLIHKDAAHLIHDFGDKALLSVVLQCWRARMDALRETARAELPRMSILGRKSKLKADHYELAIALVERAIEAVDAPEEEIL